jgi:hypothetical protein
VTGTQREGTKEDTTRGRNIKVLAPPLALVVIVGTVVAVLLATSGSSSAGCSKAVTSGLRPARPGEHCPHASTALAGGVTGRPGSTDAAEGASGATGSHRAGHGSGVSGAANTSGTGGTTGGTPGAAGGTSSPNHSDPGTHTGKAHNGASGLAGSSQPTSAPGGSGVPGATPTGVLAVHQTETGTWSVDSGTKVLEVEPQITGATITFPTPLPRPLGEPSVMYVNEAEAKKPGSARSSAIKTACGESGTVSSPTALTGYLCVYSASEDFRSHDTSGGIPTKSDGKPFVDGQFDAIINSEETPGADKTGARVAFGVPAIRSTEEEGRGAFPHIAAHGSWAVTAP